MYVLSQRVHYCTLELMPLPRKSAEPKCNYNVVPYTSYYKENWPMATSPVRGEPSRTLQVLSRPKSAVFYRYSWDVHGWENRIVTRRISVHTQVRDNEWARQWTATNAAGVMSMSCNCWTKVPIEFGVFHFEFGVCIRCLALCISVSI
jgi:hypothetical protein